MSGQLVAVGINHTAAPVQLRERLAVPESDQGPVLRELAEAAALQESMLVSTCNRVEIYGIAEHGDAAGRAVLRQLASMRGVPVDEVETHGFVRSQGAAARHIFRVTASLESMVLGEPQILGQVKDAFQRARDLGSVGPVLDKCMTAAFRGAKRVRTETDIARGAASVPSVAVDLARSIFGELRGCAVMVVGAGEMAQHAAVHLKTGGVSEVVVVNRSKERGEALATEVGGRYEPWESLDRHLQRVDIVVTSTGATVPVIHPKVLRGAMKARRQRPLFLIDIAVPRDVDPAANDLDHVFLYNIDDLQSIVHDNMRNRASEADAAGSLVEGEIAEFLRWQRTRAVGPLIGKLQAHGRAIAQAEVDKLLPKLPELPPDKHRLLQQLAHGICNKLLHAPIRNLKAGMDREPAELPAAPAVDLAAALEELFSLGEEPRRAAQADPEPGVAPAKTTASS